MIPTRLERRDLGKEQQSLKDILGTRGGEFQGFDKDASIKAKLDKEIQRKTYDTARPVFQDDKKYNIGRLKKEANRPTVMEAAELYKRQAEEARPERLAQITEKAQRIDDPYKRNSFIAAAQAADNNKIGGILERALNVYSAEDERRQKALQEALALYNEDLAQSQALEAADLENEAINELRAAGVITDQMMLEKQLKDLGFSLPKKSGGRGGRRGGGGSSGSGDDEVLDSLSKWVIGGGVYGKTPEEAAAILGIDQAIDDQYMQLEGYGYGDRTREQLISDLQGKYGDTVDVADYVYNNPKLPNLTPKQIQDNKQYYAKKRAGEEDVVARYMNKAGS